MLKNIVIDIRKIVLAFGNLDNYLGELDRLEAQLVSPCTIAFVGTMSSGKSTLLNSIFGQELSPIAATEKTATLNYFHYHSGQSKLICHWANGEVTEESLSFIQEIQGNDSNTLDKSQEVAYVEYLINDENLRSLSLVDTPGIGSVIDTHEDRVLELLNMQVEVSGYQPNERNGSIVPELDGIIYVFPAKVRDIDVKLLQASSNKINGYNPYHAFGIITQIDKSSEFLENKHHHAAQKSIELQDYLTTVVPVSGELIFHINKWNNDSYIEFEELFQVVQNIVNSEGEEMFEIYLISEEDLPDELYSVYISGGFAWSAFKLILITILQNMNRTTSLHMLKTMAGYSDLISLFSEISKRSDQIRELRIAGRLSQTLSAMLKELGKYLILQDRLDVLASIHNVQKSLTLYIESLNRDIIILDAIQKFSSNPSFGEYKDRIRMLVDHAENNDNKLLSTIQLKSEQEFWLSHTVNPNPIIRKIARKLVWYYGTLI